MADKTEFDEYVDGVKQRAEQAVGEAKEELKEIAAQAKTEFEKLRTWVKEKTQETCATVEPVPPKAEEPPTP